MKQRKILPIYSYCIFSLIHSCIGLISCLKMFKNNNYMYVKLYVEKSDNLVFGSKQNSKDFPRIIFSWFTKYILLYSGGYYCLLEQ